MREGVVGGFCFCVSLLFHLTLTFFLSLLFLLPSSFSLSLSLFKYISFMWAHGFCLNRTCVSDPPQSPPPSIQPTLPVCHPPLPLYILPCNFHIYSISLIFFLCPNSIFRVSKKFPLKGSHRFPLWLMELRPKLSLSFILHKVLLTNDSYISKMNTIYDKISTQKKKKSFIFCLLP